MKITYIPATLQPPTLDFPVYREFYDTTEPNLFDHALLLYPDKETMIVLRCPASSTLYESGKMYCKGKNTLFLAPTDEYMHEPKGKFEINFTE